MDAAMQRQRISDEAAEWVVRLSRSSAPELREAFEAWRAQGMDYEIAYEREAAIWDRLGRLNALRTTQDPPVAIIPARRNLTWRRMTVAAAGLAATVVLVLTPLLAVSPTKAYATGVGQQERVRLDDGTLVELNTDSRIEVQFGRHTRTVRLVRGEAMFHVARDARPFTVQTPSARLETPKADFTVRLVKTGASVLVSHGAALATETGGNGDVVAIDAATQAVFAPDQAKVVKISDDDMERKLAWRHGAIELDGETLSDAAGEFNRYSTRQIVIADPATAALHVGGYFRDNDVDAFVFAITNTFPVKVASSSSEKVVLEKSK